jgi:hypothetical protein
MKKLVALTLLAAAVGTLAPIASGAGSAIPGLRVKDVSQALAVQDFECEGPARVAGVPTWTCTKNLGGAVYVVKIAGSSATQVSKVRAVATINKGKVDPLARTFVGYIATIPYRGSNPTKAQLWAQKHVAGGTTKIGPVTFTISAAGKKRTIELKA